MKRILILAIALLGFATLSKGQTIVGGAGVISVDADPNTITAINGTLDARYNGLIAVNGATGGVWRYDGSQVAGSRWVTLLGSNPDGSETIVTAGTNVTVTGTGTVGDPYVINSTQVTQEEIEDFVGALINGGTGITATYDDAGGAVNLVFDASTATITPVDLDNDGANETTVDAAFAALDAAKTVAVDHAAAGVAGVAIGEEFEAAVGNTMGVPPGTIVTRRF